VRSCLKFFLEKYGVAVDVFNANKAPTEYIRVKLVDPTLSFYYLIYWGEHVFPCHG
jgi:hypothetical protein